VLLANIGGGSSLQSYDNDQILRAFGVVGVGVRMTPALYDFPPERRMWHEMGTWPLCSLGPVPSIGGGMGNETSASPWDMCIEISIFLDPDEDDSR